MKRKITVKAGPLTIVAVFHTNGHVLQRDEVEQVRDQIADRLLEAASDVKWIGVPANRVRVT